MKIVGWILLIVCMIIGMIIGFVTYPLHLIIKGIRGAWLDIDEYFDKTLCNEKDKYPNIDPSM